MAQTPTQSSFALPDQSLKVSQLVKFKNPPKLLFFIGVDWFFYSHFLDRAVAAKKAGYDVVVLTGLTCLDSPLAKHGIKLVGIPFTRRSLNPIQLIRNLVDVIRVLRAEQPDIIHQIALKPILIGSLAVCWLGKRRIINAVVGLGYAFSSQTHAAKVARWLMSILFRLVFKSRNAKTVFENSDDRAYFIHKNWIKKESAFLIRGAGVDIERFKPLPHLKANTFEFGQPNQNSAAFPYATHTDLPVVMLLSRMLWDKGVGEFVQAARELRKQHGIAYARFILVGDTDDDNRGAIGRNQLQSWQQEDVIEWWGFRPDVENVLSLATISCLPSYREGLPKSLLESLAMGLPCIATDVPGCREVVIDGLNGLVIPPRDPSALANAINFLIQNPQLWQQYGAASRKMAVEQFSREIVNEQTLALYDRVLKEAI